ncbi:hypothetical protein BpHYR1_039504 [Brachionus plicatilis]|uniref:Uncharacterized protein n=1 Tax=Brachionus plicatilis TaxID=10195 RepID=A0A3M7Q790_BRAPC|nr:hypothetical protein BpHYR1_039504 [Brachionus plicatilis]
MTKVLNYSIKIIYILEKINLSKDAFKIILLQNVNNFIPKSVNSNMKPKVLLDFFDFQIKENLFFYCYFYLFINKIIQTSMISKKFALKTLKKIV